MFTCSKGYKHRHKKLNINSNLFENITMNILLKIISLMALARSGDSYARETSFCNSWAMCKKYKEMAKLDVAFLTEDEFQVDS